MLITIVGSTTVIQTGDKIILKAEKIDLNGLKVGRD